MVDELGEVRQSCHGHVAGGVDELLSAIRQIDDIAHVGLELVSRQIQSTLRSRNDIAGDRRRLRDRTEARPSTSFGILRLSYAMALRDDGSRSADKGALRRRPCPRRHRM
ncbi:hypothetical protein ACQR16_09890 [Bradyrhizobium oligotrophicum]|uniref:hypothetical protein n=1 Tax=Bradyrhizobium oligotrophicum TaxID=44255 RepID=UPI003EBEC6F0